MAHTDVAVFIVLLESFFENIIEYTLQTVRMSFPMFHIPLVNNSVPLHSVNNTNDLCGQGVTYAVMLLSPVSHYMRNAVFNMVFIENV